MTTWFQWSQGNGGSGIQGCNDGSVRNLSAHARAKGGSASKEAMIARQQKQIEALTAGLQKVSAQLEMSKPAPQTVLNGQ
jgi:hypothetical protein